MLCLSWRNQDIWPNENTFTKHSLKGIYWRTAIKSFRWIYSNLIMERGQSHGWGSNSDWNHPRHEIFAKIWFKFALLWNQATNIMPFIQKWNWQTSMFYEYMIMPRYILGFTEVLNSNMSFEIRMLSKVLKVNSRHPSVWNICDHVN